MYIIPSYLFDDVDNDKNVKIRIQFLIKINDFYSKENGLSEENALLSDSAQAFNKNIAQVLSPSGVTLPTVDCNMDQIITKITLQGYILSIDSTNFKIWSNSSNNSGNFSKMNYSQSKSGLLIDYNHLISTNNTQNKLKLLDYVHSNDLNHLQKHINDGNFKKIQIYLFYLFIKARLKKNIYMAFFYCCRFFYILIFIDQSFIDLFLRITVI